MLCQNIFTHIIPGLLVRTLQSVGRDNIMLKRILEEFLHIEGVTSAALIGRDGFIIEFAQSDSLNIEALGALGSIAMSFFSRFGTSLDMGSLQQIVLEHHTGAIIITQISDDGFLAIITDTKSNIGHLTYVLPKIYPRVAAVVGA
jgi:predicted regulator of Ras-like GTPase activity (Roadblock/LC7/MglB family)